MRAAGRRPPRHRRQGFTKDNKDALFHAAHDIKGEAATFGYPAWPTAADSLCRLIEYTPDATSIPITLVEQHVDAVRAIMPRICAFGRSGSGRQLTGRLREVTDEFLLHRKSRPAGSAGANQDRRRWQPELRVA